MGVKKLYGAEGRGDTLLFNPALLKIITDKSHALYDPRVERDTDERFERLVVSIMKRGVKVPLLIGRDGEEPYVIDGKQRTRATIEANKRRAKEGLDPILVPCIWARADEVTQYETMVITNQIRSENTMEERAHAMQHLINMGRTEEQLTEVFGVTLQTVKNTLLFFDLHKDVQKSVSNGTPVTVAMELAKLPKAEQPAALEKLVASGNIKGARGLEAAKNVRKGKDAESTKVRMMSRVALEDWKKALKKSDGKDVEVAYAVISRILGGERSLANHPRLKETLEAAQGEEK